MLDRGRSPVRSMDSGQDTGPRLRGGGLCEYDCEHGGGKGGMSGERTAAIRLYLINPCNPLVSLTRVKESRWNRYRVWKPLSPLVVGGLAPLQGLRGPQASARAGCQARCWWPGREHTVSYHEDGGREA